MGRGALEAHASITPHAPYPNSQYSKSLSIQYTFHQYNHPIKTCKHALLLPNIHRRRPTTHDSIPTAFGPMSHHITQLYGNLSFQIHGPSASTKYCKKRACRRTDLSRDGIFHRIIPNFVVQEAETLYQFRRIGRVRSSLHQFRSTNIQRRNVFVSFVRGDFEHGQSRKEYERESILYHFGQKCLHLDGKHMWHLW